MALFCRYMDDALCPAIKFSQRHFIEVAVDDMDKLHRLEHKVQDVAICAVSRHEAMRKKVKSKESLFGRAHGTGRSAGVGVGGDAVDGPDLASRDSLPYYFVVCECIIMRRKYTIDDRPSLELCSESTLFRNECSPGSIAMVWITPFCALSKSLDTTIGGIPPNAMSIYKANGDFVARDGASSDLDGA